MNIETKQVNITAVFTEDVLSLAQTKVSEIRSKVIELWDESPIVTQFPELIALIIPKEQISVTIQNKAIIVANQNIKPFEERDIEKFLQLVRNVLEILPKEMSAYGYNYHFSSSIEEKEITLVTEKLNGIINFDQLNIKKTDVLGSGVNFAYLDSGIRKQIVITPNFANDLKILSSLLFSCNIHYFENKLPEYSKLLESFKKEHSNTSESIKTIVN